MIKAEKPSADAELRRRIQELIDYKGGGFNPDAVADIIENALKILKDVEDTGDVRVIQTAVRELRYAFRLFAPYAGVRKVAIFGSARTQPARMEYQQAVEFGRKMTEAGFMVITGAGGGIMQAGHEGAGPEKSILATKCPGKKTMQVEPLSTYVCTADAIRLACERSRGGVALEHIKAKDITAAVSIFTAANGRMHYQCTTS